MPSYYCLRTMASTLESVRRPKGEGPQGGAVLSHSEEMARIHLAALFTSKVLYACRRLGITPWTESPRPSIDLNAILAEAEAELGLTAREEELQQMSNEQRLEAMHLSAQRKNFAYSDFLRRTSSPPRAQRETP